MEITRLPEFKTGDTEGTIKQLKSYIIRLDRALSVLLDNVGSENLAPELYDRVYTETDNKVTALKNEIIETATQIKATSDRIDLRLNEEYVAKSEIGMYTEQAFQQIEVDGKGVTQYFEEITQLSGRVDDAEENFAQQSNELQQQSDEIKAQSDEIKAQSDEIKAQSGEIARLNERVDQGATENGNSFAQVNSEISKINAYIRTGKLDEGVYGIEIGNFSSDAVAPYKVRLSENKLSFYIANVEVAYFSDDSMYINDATVLSSLKIGDCTVKDENGLSFSY